jgi:hypothetical protein
MCRAPLNIVQPFTNNFTVDQMVEAHIEALGKTGVKEWQADGLRRVEWEKRKRYFNQLDSFEIDFTNLAIVLGKRLLYLLHLPLVQRIHLRLTEPSPGKLRNFILDVGGEGR